MAKSTAMTTSETLSPTPSLTAQDEAISTVCAMHLHQHIWLPATASHPRLRVTYATTSNWSDTSLPIILFCPPMFAGRAACLSTDHTVKEYGVRVLSIDRPGMGGSTRTTLDQRVPVWIETVAALLERLEIQYIDCVVCHSAGTIYALNTISHFRERLHPKHPHLAVIAPWVHFNHSNTTLAAIASKLPNAVASKFHTVPKFLNTQVMPIASWSGGLATSIADLFQTSPGAESSASTDAADRYGTSEATAQAIEKFSAKCTFAEDITGASEEFKLCLKKGGDGMWGVCEDYARFVREFVEGERERRRRRLESPGGTGEEVVKFRVDAYFAASDMMIGKGGQKYFEECWRQQGVEEVVDFEAEELPETNHETAIVCLKKGALPAIFEKIAELARED